MQQLFYFIIAFLATLGIGLLFFATCVIIGYAIAFNFLIYKNKKEIDTL